MMILSISTTNCDSSAVGHTALKMPKCNTGNANFGQVPKLSENALKKFWELAYCIYMVYIAISSLQMDCVNMNMNLLAVTLPRSGGLEY